ncbi:succinate dehydrogenase, hydrophobic membrane anchor protein [Arenimonas sp. GDDSR-1]|uniref:succinate dehydrogenase, hydrophobic membrane anchor protein n=1 Tax=Arenimonas sp. GDDSR-1 TaxID=2950125 RepID=UPI00260303B5|nr:succinate dehydrogenase, hydrophobic membrane anchor protein [Arenimonas sp. GDDSR-1]
MNLRDPLATARGLGSAKTGFGHWWAQRVSAVVLALLTPFAVYCLARYGIADYAALKAQFANPLWSAALVLYVLALFWHARLGLQVVVEDYVHHGAFEIVLQVLIKIVFSFAAVAAVIAIVRLASGS